LTGAGDMFAGAFLYGITPMFHRIGGQGGLFLAMKVITQVARPPAITAPANSGTWHSEDHVAQNDIENHVSPS